MAHVQNVKHDDTSDERSGQGAPWGTISLLALSLVALFSTGCLTLLVPSIPGKTGLLCLHLVSLAAAFWALARLVLTTLIGTKRNAFVDAVSKSLASSLGLFLVLEGIFTFVPRTHAGLCSLASQVWMLYYWHPTNSRGYRDHEWDPEQLANKRVVVAVGDSFTAGMGIKRIADRYSDLAARSLPDDVVVLNMGQYASDTQNELVRLTDLPFQPDCIVLQYFMDDAKRTAVEAGVAAPDPVPYENLHVALRPLVKGSHLLNYVYWLFPQPEFLMEYRDFLLNALRDAKVRERHFEDLYVFVDLSKECGIHLIAVLFPSMTQLEESESHLRSVESFFQAHGVAVVNVLPLVQEMKTADRTVNSTDEHASRTVHQRVAKELARELRTWLAQQGP